MTLYETLMKNCLAEYDKCNEPNCIKQGKCVDNCRLCFKEKFYAERGTPVRPYDCEAMTIAYLLCYCNKYASEILTALYQCTSLLGSGNLNVVSIGCGPGTELLALERYAKQNNYTGNINYTGFDKDKGWGYAQGVLTRTLLEYDPNTKIHLQWEQGLLMPNNSLLPTTNLLILNYVASDVYKRGKQVLAAFFGNLTNIVNILPHGACIIINDANSRDMGRNEVDKWCYDMAVGSAFHVAGYLFKYSKWKDAMRFYWIRNVSIETNYLLFTPTINGEFSPDIAEKLSAFTVNICECTSAFAVLCKL